MAKKLRDLIQKNVVKAGDYGDGSFDNPGGTKSSAKKFCDLHRIDRVNDANGNDDKLFKASNIKKADHPRADESENLDEISKNRASEYINRAYKEAPARRKETEGVRGVLNASLHPKLFMKTLHKDWKRRQGVKQATDKLGGAIHTRVWAGGGNYFSKKKTNEETEVNEISQKKLIDYIGKATTNYGQNMRNDSTHLNDSNFSYKKSLKRSIGINRASRKLTGIKHFSKDDKHLGDTSSRVPATKK